MTLLEYLVSISSQVLLTARVYPCATAGSETRVHALRQAFNNAVLAAVTAGESAAEAATTNAKSEAAAEALDAPEVSSTTTLPEPAPASSRPIVEVIEATPVPIIGQALANQFGVRGGFETGNAVRDDAGGYHLFLGERAPPTTYVPGHPFSV